MNKQNITNIAIGGFDGMHIAHQELFKKLGEDGAIVVIETGYANLTPHTTRSFYTNLPIYYYDLKEIRNLSAKEFISLLKEEYPNLQKIVVGYDFRFGKNASYDVNDLKNLFSGEVIVVDEFIFDGISVHSRAIREFLINGDIKMANKLLGKNYQICGLHIKGQGLGAKEFVPTINIKVSDFLIPNEGVYKTNTIVNNITYSSVTFIGHRVSTDGTFAIETHIINQDIKVKNKKILIEFIRKNRDNKKFANFEELKKQIKKDIECQI